MADENKPAFYPRVGNIKAKNFKSAQPMPFIDDPRAMELPRFGEDSDQFGRVDVGVASQQNLELGRRMVERENQLRRQREADRSIPEKLAGGVQAGRFLGSALTQGINSIPTRLVHGDEAADKFIQDRIYKPEQPLAYEYAQDVGDFLEKLETEYKIPPVLPEAVALQYLTGPALSQAMKATGKGAEQVGRKLESAMEPVVRGALERGGLPREMVMAMGANTQSNVMKPSNKANWMSGPNIHVPEGDAWRFKTQTVAGETPEQRIPRHEELLNDPTLNQDQIDRVLYQLELAKGEAALDKWADNALMGYFKGQLASPEDPVRLMIERNYANIEAKFAKDQERATKMAQRAEAELDPRKQANMKRQADTMFVQARDDRDVAMQNISHLPSEMLQDITLDPKSYIKEERVKAGYPAEGLGTTDPSRKWEHQADEAVKVTRAGDIQEAMELQPKLDKALQEQYALHNKMGEAFGNLFREKGLDEPTIQSLMNSVPRDQKAKAVGMLDELQKVDSNYLRLLDQDRSFPKFAAQDNPFVAKLDPETKMYSGYMGDLGFEHVMDVLRQDLAAERLRPEQLNKLSVEQAVKRTQEYNLEMARKMNSDRASARANLPVYKDYPDGYKWVQLNQPGNFAAESQAMGHSVKGYEPNKGHPDWVKGSGDEGSPMYGHGGWDAIKSGRAKVYSLVDSRGAPHATIEIKTNVTASPNDFRVAGLDYSEAMAEAKRRMGLTPETEKELTKSWDGTKRAEASRELHNIIDGIYKERVGDMPQTITQIKGKGNNKPVADYIPYVQDFVRGGNWHSVDDFHHTDLISADQIRKAGWDMKGNNQKFFTKQEFEDLKHAEQKRVEGDGMKRGGKVSISNNPDTMMLEVNNQKMKNGVPAYAGGKLIVGKGLKAAKPPKIEVPRLSMQFGNDLPINMNTAEVENLARRFPEPTVDRVNMAHKDVLKRTPELQEAAARIEAGDISADEYARLVQRYKPVTPYESVPAPASREEILAALSKTSREAEGLPRKETYFGKPSSTLKEGDPVGLRLDIPSYNQANTWVVTAHGPRKSPVSGGAGTRIGYEPVAMATDVDFSVSPKAALGIAKGAEKNTIATMEGKWKPTSSDEAFTLAKQYLKNPEWRQVGMDPERHSYFYDRETMAPVVNAEEVIQIGPLVLAKNPKFGKPEDFKYSGGGLTGGIKQGLKVAKPPKLEVPIRFPVSRGPTVPEIRAMAERMAPQVMGEFVREAPTASKPNPSANVVGKSKKQFDREKNLQIGYQDIKPPVTPQEFDYAAHKDDLLIGAAGDVTPANRMLLSIDNQPLSHAVHQQGGPEWALYNPSGWAATDEMAKTWMKRADKAAEAYGAQPHLHYHKMTPDANWYAMHHLHSLLGHMRPEELKFKNPELYSKMIEEIRSKDVGFGKHPEFEGFDDPLNLNIHAQIDPHFRRHLGKVLGSPTFAERYGLNSGVDVMAATSLPDLRDLEVGSSGYAVVPLDTKAPLQHFAADSQTYDTGFPMKGEPKRSKYPSPYELVYRDTLNWMKAHPSENKSSEFGRMNMIVPKQQIDNELIEAIGEYQRRMKELTGKKKGGAVKKAEGGYLKKPAAYINGDEFVNAAKKYGIKDSMNNLNKIVDLVNKGLSVDDAARQVADTGMHKAAGGAIRGDDLILEERPL
jgi:hypothetical protein